MVSSEEKERGRCQNNGFHGKQSLVRHGLGHAGEAGRARGTLGGEPRRRGPVNPATGNPVQGGAHRQGQAR